MRKRATGTVRLLPVRKPPVLHEHRVDASRNFARVLQGPPHHLALLGQGHAIPRPPFVRNAEQFLSNTLPLVPAKPRCAKKQCVQAKAQLLTFCKRPNKDAYNKWLHRHLLFTASWWLIISLLTLDSSSQPLTQAEASGAYASCQSGWSAAACQASCHS